MTHTQRRCLAEHTSQHASARAFQITPQDGTCPRCRQLPRVVLCSCSSLLHLGHLTLCVFPGTHGGPEFRESAAVPVKRPSGRRKLPSNPRNGNSSDGEARNSPVVARASVGSGRPPKQTAPADQHVKVGTMHSCTGSSSPSGVVFGTGSSSPSGVVYCTRCGPE